MFCFRISDEEKKSYLTLALEVNVLKHFFSSLTKRQNKLERLLSEAYLASAKMANKKGSYD